VTEQGNRRRIKRCINRRKASRNKRKWEATNTHTPDT